MPRQKPARQGGFNLVELMVTVGILSILFSIAIPQYRNYSLRANRTDGLAILNEILQAQERFAADNGAYTADLTDMGYDAAPTSADGHYVISAAACGGGLAECVLITATAQGPQRDDENGNSGNLSINSRGTKLGF